MKKKKTKKWNKVPTSDFYVRCHVILFYNVLGSVCVCVLCVTHTHPTPTHTRTHTDRRLQLHLGHFSHATLYSCLKHVWDPLFDETGEMVGKKKTGGSVCV